MQVVRPKQIYLEPEETVEVNKTVVYPWATVCLVNGKFPAGVCDPGVPKLPSALRTSPDEHTRLNPNY